MKGKAMDNYTEQAVTQADTGVTQEVAVPTDGQPVQPTVQNAEQVAQPTADGLGTTENQESVPYPRFQQMNESNKAQVEALQQQLQLSQQQNMIYQQNMQQPPQTQEPSRLQVIADKLSSVDDNDSLYGKEAKEMLGAMQEEMQLQQQREQQGQTLIREQMFLAQNPDFSELVQYDTPVGKQFRPEFIEMLNSNPMAQNELSMLANDRIQQSTRALQLAKDFKRTRVAQGLQQPVPQQPVYGQPTNTIPPSLSAIPTGQQGQVNSYNTVANMNDAQLEQWARANKGKTQ